MSNFDIIFCGNPGTGKSTLLFSISGIQFQSGLSFGGGLTTTLEFKETNNFPGTRFGDTPGLSDIHIAEKASQAITSALQDAASKGRITLIFFVVTVESGRIRPNDLFTIKQVMGSIKLPNGYVICANNYGVIINKCTFLNNNAFLNGGKQKLQTTFSTQSNSVPFTTNYINFIPNDLNLVNAANGAISLGGLKEWIFNFSGIKIAYANKIDVSNYEEQLRKTKELQDQEMAELERKLNEERERQAQEIKRKAEEEQRNLQRQIEDANRRRHHHRNDCIIS